jgi:kynureninase
MQSVDQIDAKTKAHNLDQSDELQSYRSQFHIPLNQIGEPLLYFCGNSLGLQPKITTDYVQQELEDWKNLGVKGHTDAKNPWMPYHEFLTDAMAKIVGAKPQEVVMMNTLSVNLHLMMVSFYQPTAKRSKILIEKDAFPSDRYAVESQLKFHNIDPKDGLVLWEPDEDSAYYSKGSFERIMEKEGDNIALVMIGCPNYYNGQCFDLSHIVQKSKAKGCKVGFDLAHGAGNIQPDLHDVEADFAVWCSYKYLNSGPGSVAGCFVHEKHIKKTDIKRFTGWWGHEAATRFKMPDEFKPTPSAEAWQLSNPPILSMAAIRASLKLFNTAGFDNLRQKSVLQSDFLMKLLDELPDNQVTYITPKAANEKGCQVSIRVKNADKSLFDQLSAQNLVADWREPDVIRIAPTPLYNSFDEIYRFVELLKSTINVQ